MTQLNCFAKASRRGGMASIRQLQGRPCHEEFTVKDAKGNVIHKTTYYSNYARVTGIVLVGR